MTTLVYGAEYTLDIPADALEDWVSNNLAGNYTYSFIAQPSWNHIDTGQSDWQQGTLDKVTDTVYGDLELKKAEDNFTDTTLNRIWMWDVPITGPTYSLTARPGWFRIATPQGDFNHWNNTDRAPKLRLPVNSGDWVLETKYDLSTFTDKSNFHAGLLVYFGQYDCYYCNFRRVEFQ